MRLLLLGCTGFIGRALVPQLLNAGYQLTLVSRKPIKALYKNCDQDQVSVLQLDPSDPMSWYPGPLLTALTQAEGVVNMAGEPIAEKRWTNEHRQKIESSRLVTTRSLVDAMKQLKRPPRVLLNASAIGYYGTSQESDFIETSACGEDFLAKLCQRWEAAASKRPSSTRLVILRLGIVLGMDGGALGKMLPVFKAGFGGPLGNGQQWMSWIERSDLCELILRALEERKWSGVINAVSTEPVSMKDFATCLGQCLGRPSLLPVPALILRFLLGDGARVVLEGQKVTSNRLKKMGFQLKHSNLSEALQTAIKIN